MIQSLESVILRKDGRLAGKIKIKGGDDSTFIAEREREQMNHTSLFQIHQATATSGDAGGNGEYEVLPMAKILRVDNDFTPCPVATGDELFPNGIFVFNITKILEYIQKQPDSITLEEVAASDFFEGFSSINESQILHGKLKCG